MDSLRSPGAHTYLKSLTTQVEASQGLLERVNKLHREGTAKLKEREAEASKRAAVAELRALELEALLMMEQLGRA